MGPIPFAFSVHHFINSVGADAGFASIIGLAILVLLYFAQARETSSLREQAYESAQRVQQLEARIAQLTRQVQVRLQPPAPVPAPIPPAARPLVRRRGRIGCCCGLVPRSRLRVAVAAPAFAGGPSVRRPASRRPR